MPVFRVMIALELACVARGACPGSSELERAASLVQQAQFAGALAVLKPCAASLRTDARYWNLTGIAQGELGQTEAAREAFRRGLMVLPGDVGLLENLGFLYFREERYAEAKDYLAQAVSQGSGNPGARFSLAAARLRTGQGARGEAELAELEPLLSNSPEYWDERGFAALGRNGPEAGAHFARALALQDQDVRALNGAAAVAERERKEEQALSFLLRAKAAAPNDVETLVHFGNVCIRRDLLLDAVPALEHAHKLEPGNDAALYALARALLGTRQWQRSYQLFAEFARRVPGSASAWYAMGWLNLQLNQRETARQELEHCLRLAPQAADPRYELAQMSLDEGDVARARSQLADVLRQNPRHAKANAAFGDLLLKGPDWADARAYYEKAIEAEPRWGAPHYKLAGVLARLNRTEDAAAERQRGLALNAEALQASKTAMRLAAPDGSLLSGERQ